MKRILIAVVMFFMTNLASASQEPPLLIQQQGFSGSLPEALRYIATTFHLPLVAECYDIAKVRITLPAGPLESNAALAQVVRMGQLRLQRRGNLSYVFDSALVHDKHNLLNHEFPSFNVPRDADMFLAILISRVHNDATKKPGDPSIGGFVLSFPPNAALKDKLQEETLKNISARNLLLKEAASLSFWVVVSYPYPPLKKQTKESANQFPIEGHWVWGDVPPKP